MIQLFVFSSSASFPRLYKLKDEERKRGCQRIVIIYFDWFLQLTSTVWVKPLPAHSQLKLIARSSIMWSNDCPEIMRWIWSVQCQQVQGTAPLATSNGIVYTPKESNDRIKPCRILFLDEKNPKHETQLPPPNPL